MKILIVSDTHKKNENYFKVLEMHHPDMVIHCGDAEGSEYALSSAAECPVYIVLGNNDFFSDLPREITLDIGSYKVWVTHGHNYYVSMGNETIKKEASLPMRSWRLTEGERCILRLLIFASNASNFSLDR